MDNELLWKNYNLQVELYRSYLELALKVNIFYYAITGAILSYYFAHIEEPSVKLALLLPFLMSLALGIFLIYGAIISDITRTDILNTAGKLGFKVIPEVKVLKYLLLIFGSLMILVALGIVYLFFCYH